MYNFHIHLWIYYDIIYNNLLLRCIYIIFYRIARLNKLADVYIWLGVYSNNIIYMDIIPFESNFFMILKHILYINKGYYI